jgi:hypothetical protein
MDRFLENKVSCRIYPDTQIFLGRKNGKLRDTSLLRRGRETGGAHRSALDRLGPSSTLRIN